MKLRTFFCIILAFMGTATAIAPEKREQETRSLESVLDGFKKIIVVKDVIKPYYDEKGILTIGLFDFLMDSSWM